MHFSPSDLKAQSIPMSLSKLVHKTPHALKYGSLLEESGIKHLWLARISGGQ
jgi:hypothetical protein